MVALAQVPHLAAEIGRRGADQGAIERELPRDFAHTVVGEHPQVAAEQPAHRPQQRQHAPGVRTLGQALAPADGGRAGVEVGVRTLFVTEGYAPQMTGQAHHWFREALLRQYGGVPYSEYENATGTGPNAAISVPAATPAGPTHRRRAQTVASSPSKPPGGPSGAPRTSGSAGGSAR